MKFVWNGRLNIHTMDSLARHGHTLESMGLRTENFL